MKIEGAGRKLALLAADPGSQRPGENEGQWHSLSPLAGWRHLRGQPEPATRSIIAMNPWASRLARVAPTPSSTSSQVNPLGPCGHRVLRRPVRAGHHQRMLGPKETASGSRAGAAASWRGLRPATIRGSRCPLAGQRDQAGGIFGPMLSALVARSGVVQRAVRLHGSVRAAGMAVVFARFTGLAAERSRCPKRICGTASTLHVATSAKRTVLESELALHRWVAGLPMIFNGYRGR